MTDPDTQNGDTTALQQLQEALQEEFLNRTTGEWLERLTEADVPCGPVNTLEEALTDPQVMDREMAVSVEHTLGGQIKQTGNPIKMSDSPTEVTRSPLLGEHTEEILRNVLKFDDNRIREIKASGALGDVQRAAAE